MKMLKPLLWSGILMWTNRHSIVHELTFFVQDEDGRFTRQEARSDL